MITPKEKADQLVQTFGCFMYSSQPELSFERSKKCVLIAVDELIAAFRQLSIEESGRVEIDFGHGFWELVKIEIQKL